MNTLDYQNIKKRKFKIVKVELEQKEGSRSKLELKSRSK